MNQRNRNRMLWAMSALVVGYAIVNVIFYFVSGTFGTSWFVTSLAVYAVLLVGAILLMVRDVEPEQVVVVAQTSIDGVQAPVVSRAPSPEEALARTVRIDVQTAPAPAVSPKVEPKRDLTGA